MEKSKITSKKVFKYLGLFILILILLPFWEIAIPGLGIWILWRKTGYSLIYKVVGTIFFIFVFFIFIGSSSNNTTQSNKHVPKVAELSNNSKDTNIVTDNKKEEKENKKYFSYKIYKKESNNLVDNYYVYLELGNFDKEYVKSFLIEFNKNCTRDCNIFIYDNLEAIEKEYEREEFEEQIYSKYPYDFKKAGEILEEWDMKNYIFIADHFIAMKSFETEPGEYISYFPYKDWYYKELKELK